MHLDEIVCIEANKKSNLIFTTTSGEYEVKGKIVDYKRKLSDKYFIDIHRSCLANLRYIRKFNSKTLEFTTGKTVPISRRKISIVSQAFIKYMTVRYK